MNNLKVTIIQTALHWENAERNRDYLGGLIAKIDEPTNLVVLPEMFTTGFSMQSAQLAEPVNGATTQWLKSVASERGFNITGSIITLDNGVYYNRMLLVKPDGTVVTYDKRHLFRMANENEFYGAGNKRVIAEVDGWRLCLNVCYDLRFPVWSRNRNDYDVLLYVANWPEPRRTAWHTLLRARAIENLCYTVGVNRIGSDGKNVVYAGDSAVIDFKGNTMSNTLPFEESVETVELSHQSLVEYREKFPAWRDADQFELHV